MSDAYRAAGVDIAGADELVRRIASPVTATWGDRVIGGFGGFAAGIRIPTGYTSPILMLSTDGVGTKLDVARRAGRWDGVGQDLVAMCVDDLAAVGAEPIGFVDYLAVGRLDPERDERLVRSVAAACSLAGCALVGGETAEHPGVVDVDHVDLAGAALGVVEESAVLAPGLVAVGDVVVGVRSPNLRSNGFSLVRRILADHRLDVHDPFPDGSGRTVAEAVLEPSVIYAPAAVAAARLDGVHGLCHVTGGGIVGNLPRVLPDHLGAVIDSTTWEPPSVFTALVALGELGRADAFGTFNMGLGYLAVVDPAAVDAVIGVFDSHGHAASVVGTVVADRQGVELV